jgi:hypothetical protein
MAMIEDDGKDGDAAQALELRDVGGQPVRAADGEMRRAAAFGLGRKGGRKAGCVRLGCRS